MEDGLQQNPDIIMGTIKSFLQKEIYYPDYAPLISKT